MKKGNARTYKSWQDRFSAHDLEDFTLTREGLLWLKLRSIERRELLASFVEDAGLGGVLTRKDRMERIWSSLCASADLQSALLRFMAKCQQRENHRIDSSFETIRSNLYRMSEFHWGGGFRNSLDKAIVSRYVKTDEIVPYERIEAVCDGELRAMARGYLLNSWYDYWSSVLIENVFRRQKGVMPAPGKIKNVDFFVDDVPFDLKVTYVPREYAKLIRKQLGMEDPVRLLKRFAKEHEIPYGKDSDEETLRYELEQKIADSQTVDGRRLLRTMKEDWCNLVRYMRDNAIDLIRWLYENQGDMRFGAENRVFLILVDMQDPYASWKLKRNVDLLSPAIGKWTSTFKRSLIEKKRISFAYNGTSYHTFADIVFVCKC